MSWLKQTGLTGVVPLSRCWMVVRDTRPRYGLIPPPGEVADALVDRAIGAEDDAFRGTLLTHVLASIGRVYCGGFADGGAGFAALHA